MGKREINLQIGAAIAQMIADGYVRPIIGPRFAFEDAAQALKCLDERRATGKVILDVRSATA
jgi:NADPH2:quinone reductase